MARHPARFPGYQAAFVVAALLAAACGSERLMGPTPARGPGIPNIDPGPAPEYWALASTLVSVGNAEDCGWDGAPVGATRNYPLTVRRADSQVRLVYGDVMDEVELVGILEGDAFTASANIAGYALRCRGEMQNLVFESRAAGRFSADGTALTARETVTYRFASGEAIVYTFDWMATRRS
jgi:hypothetical protein